MEEELIQILNSARENGASESQLQIIVDQFNSKKKNPEQSTALSIEDSESDSSLQTISPSLESPNLEIVDNPPIDEYQSPLYKEYVSASQITPEQEIEIDQQLVDQTQPSLWDRFRSTAASRLLGLPPKEFVPGTKTREELVSQTISKNKEEFFEELDKEQLNSLALEEYSKIESLNNENKNRVIENESFAEEREILAKEANNILEGLKLAKEKGQQPNEEAISNRISEILSQNQQLEQKMKKNISDYENSGEDLQNFNAELELFKKNWSTWESAKETARLGGARILNGFMRTNLGIGIEGNVENSDDVVDSGKFLEEIERQEASLKPKERVESINSREDLGEFIAESFAEQVPILTTIITPGGVGVIGSSEFANKKQELEIENQEGVSNFTSNQILLASAASATFETAGALVDRFALTKGARALKAGIAGGGEVAIKNGVKKYLVPIVAEMGEETAALLGNQLIDKYYLGKSNVEIGDDFLNTIAKTAVTVGFIHTAPTLVGDAAGSFHTKRKKAIIQDNLLKVAELNKQLENSSLSEKEASLINDKISKIAQENGKILESTIGLIGKLNSEQKKQIAQLQDNINEQKASIQEIQGSKNLSDKAKKELISDFESDIEFNENQKEEILNTVNSPQLNSVVNQELTTEFNPLESEGESIARLKTQIENGKPLEQVVQEHSQSYQDYIKDQNAQEVVESDFAKTFEEGLEKALKSNKNFDSNQERTQENGSRIDADGNQISELAFLESQGKIETDNSFAGIDSVLESEVNLPNNNSEAQETVSNTEVNLPQTENTPNSRELEISTNLNDYKVQVDNGALKVIPKFGNKIPSKSEVQKVTDKYIEQTNFDLGKRADPRGATSNEQITETIISESQNAVEVAQEIINVQKRTESLNQDKELSKQGAISKALESVQVNKESFARVDDKNNIKDVNRTYFNPRNKDKKGSEGNIDSIREVAQSLTDQNIELSDITQFMKDFRSPSDFKENSDIITFELGQKFQELTGLKPTTENIEKVSGTKPAQETETVENTENNQEIDDEVPFQRQSNQERIDSPELRPLIDRLKKTGLASEVRTISDAQTKSILESLGRNTEATPLGFVSEGVVYLNQEKASKDTPIHEFGHLWAQFAKENNPEVHKKGLELMQGSEYLLAIENNSAYDDLTDEQKAEEALAQAIGEKGVKILNESKKAKFNTWFKNLFTKIAKGLGIRSLNSKQLSDITLDKFTDLVAAELLAGKSVTGQEVKTTNNKVDETDVNSIDVVVAEQQAIKETRDKLNQKFKDSKTFVSDIRKELIQYIRANIDSKRVSEVQKRELSKLLTSVQKARTKNNLLKSFDQVNDIVTELDNRIIKRKIDKILGSKLSKKESGRRKANITDEQAETVLSAIKSNIAPPKTENSGNPTERRETKVVELIDRRDEILQQDEISEDMELELQSIGISIDIINALNSKDVNQSNQFLSESLEQIEEIYEDGRSRLKELRDTRKAEDIATLNALEQDANPNATQSLKTVEDIKKDISRKGNAVSRAVKKMTHTWFNGKLSGSLDSIAAFISKKGGKNRDSSPWVQFVNRLKRNETAKRRRISKFANKLESVQKDLFGSLTKADATLNKVVSIDVEILPKGEDVRVTENVDYTLSQLLNVWQNSKNEKLIPGLESNGFTESVRENIDKILPQNVKDYGESLIDLYGEMYIDANEVYKRLNFHSLGKPDFYAGKVSREGNKIEEDTNALLGGNSKMGTTGYASQKERVNNANPINAMDVNKLFKRHLQESSHYVAFAESHRVYNKVLKDPNIQKAILLNNGVNGDQILKTLTYYKVRDIEQGGERGNKVVDALGRNVARSILGLKAKIGITQTISIVNGSFDLPNNMKTSEFITNYNPKSIIQNVRFLLKNSDYMKNRYDIEGLENAVLGLDSIAEENVFNFDSAVLESKRKQAARFYKKSIDLMLSNVKYGDMAGVLGAAPVYSAWKARFLKQGMSESEANQKAMAKFEASVDRSQQSISSFGKSEIQKHPYLRYLMMFATAPIQNFQNANYHRRELIKSLKGKEFKGTNTRNALAFLNYQFAQPMLYTYLSNILAGNALVALKGLFDDEEEVTEADKAMLSSAIVGNVQAIPIIGGTLLAAIDKLVLDKKFSFATVIGSPLYDQIKAIENHIRLANISKKEASKKRHIYEATKKTSGLLGGIPNISFDVFNELDDVYWNENVSLESKTYRALGYSKKVIEGKTDDNLSKKEMSKKSKSRKPRKD